MSSITDSQGFNRSHPQQASHTQPSLRGKIQLKAGTFEIPSARNRGAGEPPVSIVEIGANSVLAPPDPNSLKPQHRLISHGGAIEVKAGRGFIKALTGNGLAEASRMGAWFGSRAPWVALRNTAVAAALYMATNAWSPTLQGISLGTKLAETTAEVKWVQAFSRQAPAHLQRQVSAMSENLDQRLMQALNSVCREDILNVANLLDVKNTHATLEWQGGIPATFGLGTHGEPGGTITPEKTTVRVAPHEGGKQEYGICIEHVVLIEYPQSGMPAQRMCCKAKLFVDDASLLSLKPNSAQPQGSSGTTHSDGYLARQLRCLEKGHISGTLSFKQEGWKTLGELMPTVSMAPIMQQARIHVNAQTCKIDRREGGGFDGILSKPLDVRLGSLGESWLQKPGLRWLGKLLTWLIRIRITRITVAPQATDKNDVTVKFRAYLGLLPVPFLTSHKHTVASLAQHAQVAQIEHCGASYLHKISQNPHIDHLSLIDRKQTDIKLTVPRDKKLPLRSGQVIQTVGSEISAHPKKGTDAFKVSYQHRAQVVQGTPDQAMNFRIKTQVAVQDAALAKPTT